ncbi:MAG: ammonium transporter [Pseudomonadota bacterium]
MNKNLFRLQVLMSLAALGTIAYGAFFLLPCSNSFTPSSTPYLSEMSSNFVVWMLICAVLVLFMQAGFLLLEAGTVRSKNSINVAQKNAADFVVCGVIFFLVGFRIAFGSGENPFFGFGEIDPLKGNASALVVMIYQFGFCATAATIISGAVAERMKFGAYLLLAAFTAGIVYPLFAHIVWGNAIFPGNPAYLADKGFIDFAGSTVVHGTAAWVALAAIMILGPRKGRFDENGNPKPIHGSSSVLAFLGTIILFIGWIGFNAGAIQPEAPELPQVIANTIIAACFGATTGMILGYVRDGGIFAPSATINGLLGGLVAVTAGVAVVSVSGAALIGMAGGVVALIMSYVISHHFKLDDPVDVIAVHGFSGVAGTLLIAVFGAESSMANGSRWDQLLLQAEGVGLNFVWSFLTAYVFLRLLNLASPIRINESDELTGLNSAEHGVSLGIDNLRYAIEAASGDPRSIKDEAILKDFRLDIDEGSESAEIGNAFNAILDKHSETIEKLEYYGKEADTANRAKSEFLANMSH